MMRVFVACEFSGTVRDAFRERGHDAISCDLLPSDVPGPHLQMDLFAALAILEARGWRPDLVIAHPPCTHLAVSGARWFKGKRAQQVEALEFVRRILAIPVRYLAMENPVSIISSRIRKPDQTIQPWQFGHGEVKRTCLWLKNLPPLLPTEVVDGREPLIWKMAPSEHRWKDRSKTYSGVAAAMAAQWGSLPTGEPESGAFVGIRRR